MSRKASCWILLAALVAVPSTSTAGTSVGVSVVVGTPSPPAIVLRREPRLTVVPGSTVCIVQEDCGYDLFYYGVYWYAFNDGHWYRSRKHRGPYKWVKTREVPSAIVNVPSRYWRHAPPHPSKKKFARDDDRVAGHMDRGRGKGHGGKH